MNYICNECGREFYSDDAHPICTNCGADEYSLIEEPLNQLDDTWLGYSE